MKVLKNITKIAFSSLLILFLVSGCRESAGLETDPMLVDIPFTFTPAQGYPGNQVVIEGTGLSTVSMVSIGVTEAEIVSKTDTKITVVVPVGALTAKIKLVSEGLVTTSATDFVVDETPVPTIISFSPEIIGSGETVTISGNNLDKVDSVYIGSLKAELLAGKMATEMQVVTPAGLQTGLIRMFYNYKTNYGMIKVAESLSESSLVLKLPTIESASLDLSALNINDEITLIGTMFSSVTAVNFGTLAATYTVVSDTEMKVLVPAGATSGKITMTVPDGSIEYGTSFAVNLPAITSFFPFKGAVILSPGTRDITLSGTKFDLVTSVKVGTTDAIIMQQTANNLTVKISGTTTGTISLISANGIVNSSAPFIITGDFWLADYDNMYTPVRLFNEPMYSGAANSESWADATQNAKTIVASGQARGNYRNFIVTFPVTGGSPRIYFRGDQGSSANPANDRFLLYTSSSQGVTFEFDISWDIIPAVMVDANNKVDLKIVFFNADQTLGGGYGYFSDHILVPYEGPGVWQHIVVDTYKTRVAGSGPMYDTSVPAVSAQKFAPNNCRIICVMFQGAYNSTAASQQMTVNFDNIKFKIQ